VLGSIPTVAGGPGSDNSYGFGNATTPTPQQYLDSYGNPPGVTSNVSYEDVGGGDGLDGLTGNPNSIENQFVSFLNTPSSQIYVADGFDQTAAGDNLGTPTVPPGYSYYTSGRDASGAELYAIVPDQPQDIVPGGAGPSSDVPYTPIGPTIDGTPLNGDQPPPASPPDQVSPPLPYQPQYIVPTRFNTHPSQATLARVGELFSAIGDGYVAGGGTSNVSVSPEYDAALTQAGFFTVPGFSTVNRLALEGVPEAYNIVTNQLSGIYAAAASGVSVLADQSGLTDLVGSPRGSLARDLALLPMVAADGGLGPVGAPASTVSNPIAETAAARHAAWSSDLGQINTTINSLGQRALTQSGGNPQLAEQIFNRYLGQVDNRLINSGSPYGIDIQPAALKNGERVPNFIYLNRGGPGTSLITGADGEPQIFAFPGSRRLDAGVIDTTAPLNQYDLQPVISGFDITLSPTKPNIVPYYQSYFGNIPIYDIRLPQ
jgi:hypothetical protein